MGAPPPTWAYKSLLLNKAGISQKMLSKIKTDEVELSFYAILRIVEALGVEALLPQAQRCVKN